MNVVTRLKIALLKERARLAYAQYVATLDGLDCGRHMAMHVSTTARIAATKFNEILDELASIDPNCPTTRIEL